MNFNRNIDVDFWVFFIMAFPYACNFCLEGNRLPIRLVLIANIFCINPMFFPYLQEENGSIRNDFFLIYLYTRIQYIYIYMYMLYYIKK